MKNRPTFGQVSKPFSAAIPGNLKLPRWTLLVLAVVAVIAFFRIYNLSGIPSEPFSDHAEKILDVYDVSQGQTHIFFPRNTGREAIQMYLTLVVSWIFGTGLSFLSLKIGTVYLRVGDPALHVFARPGVGRKKIGSAGALLYRDRLLA